MEVDSGDVLRVVLQFLTESGLERTSAALEAETGVRLNAVQDKAALRADLVAGDWLKALEQLRGCELPDAAAWTLYEEIVRDLAVNGDDAGAQQVLRVAPELARLKERDGSRFDKLQSLAHLAFSQDRQRAAEEDKSQSAVAQRRSRVAEAVCASLRELESSRLLELLGNALAWREQNGLSVDLLQNGQGSSSPLAKQESGRSKRATTGDRPSAANAQAQTTKRRRTADAGDGQDHWEQGRRIKLGQDTAAHVTAFHPSDGLTLATGSSDGFVELWNAHTGKLRTDLPYQAAEEIMMHSKAVLGLDFSSDGKLLASCSADSRIKVWAVKNGKCKTKIKDAHHGRPVNCVAFSKQGDRLASGGEDHVVRVFGVASGTLAVELRGHESQVTHVAWVRQDQAVVSGSSDHSVRLWDYRSAAELAKITLDAPLASLSVLRRAGEADETILACSRGAKLLLLDASQLAILGEAAMPQSQGNCQPVGCATSRRASLLVLALENGALFSASTSTVFGKEASSNSWNAISCDHQLEEVGVLVHHRRDGLAAVGGQDGSKRGIVQMLIASENQPAGEVRHSGQ